MFTLPLPVALVLLGLLAIVVVAGTFVMVRGTVRAVAQLDAETAAEVTR